MVCPGFPFALLQLRKDHIGEFDTLLAKCREIAAEARKDRSEFAVDFVDEPLDIEGVKTISVKNFEEDVEAAAEIREKEILPTLEADEMIVLDFPAFGPELSLSFTLLCTAYFAMESIWSPV